MFDESKEELKLYITKLFNLEHEMSSTILARLLLLGELLIEKGILEEDDLIEKLSKKNVARMMEEAIDEQLL